MPEETENLSAQQKVAILMLALGEDTAGEIMRHLSEREVEEMTQALAELGMVSTEDQDEVLEEFEQLLTAGKYVSQGGLDFARGALEKAMGPKQAQAMLDRITKTTSSGFYLLRNVDPRQIVPYLAKEHPQTVALILSQLDPEQAAGVLGGLPQEMQGDVAYRLSKMETIAPEVLRELEQNLATDLESILSGQVTEIGGTKAVAEILNRTGHTTEAGVLDYLDELDPELAEEVRNQMFTFEDVASLTDQDIRKLLQVADKGDLVTALRGASDEVKARVFSNLSKRAGQTLKEDLEFTGPVRKSEAEDAQLRIVQVVRQLEEENQITVLRGNSDDVYL